MAMKATGAGARVAPAKKRTSIGSSPLTRVNNKNKRLSFKEVQRAGTDERRAASPRP
jgi:hypothetical protein